MDDVVAEHIDEDDPYFSAVFAAKRRGERLTDADAHRLLDERRKRKLAAVFPDWVPPKPAA